MVKNIVISGTNFWNPGDDFVRDGIINILRRLFSEYTLNLLFYNFNADYFPQSKFSGISNTVARGDIEKYCHSIDAVVVAGLSAGLEIKDLYNWVIANSLQDRVYLIGAGYENNYVEKYIYEEPEATIFKNAKVIIGRTRKTPKFIPDLDLPYYHINCPSILSVDNVKNISPDRTIEKIAFSIQLPHEIGIPNQCCDKSMYELAVSILRELSRKYVVEVIAHHKSEYFHFLGLLKDFDIPVIFSSFYQALFEIYPRYDLVITTRLHSSLFANGHGIPGVIINDTDRHTHTLEGFPHSVWVNNKDKFYQALDTISEIGLHKIAQDTNKFKQSLLQQYISILSKSFGITGNKNGQFNCIRESSVEINSKTNGLLSHDKILVKKILPDFFKAISSNQVKKRVYSIFVNLQRDYWLEQNVKKYKEAIDYKQSWFDVPTFLNFYAHTFHPTNYLEIGVRRGRSMAQVLSASPQTKGFGVDLWIPDYGSLPEKGIYTTNPGPEFVLTELKKIGVTSLPTLFHGDSHKILPEFFANPHNPQQFDLILVDGDHGYEGAKLDLDIAFAHLSQGGALVFDDLSHPAHQDLKNLWNEYVNLFNDHLFIEDLNGNGIGVAFKPPFNKLLSVFSDNNSLKIYDSVMTPNNNYTFDSEVNEQKLVRNLVQEGMVVFDVGANIGKYTKLFSLLVGEKGKVYAFEPSQNSFNKISSVLNESGYSNVDLFQKAIHSKNTKVILNEFPDEYCSWNSLGKPLMEDPKNVKDFVPIIKSAEVEAITLDSFCKENHIGRIDYLKLDVEGAEVFALEGALELLKNKAIRYLQFEISQKMLEGLNTKAQYVFDLLIANGYECHTISKDGTIGGKVIDSDSFYENYIAFPVNHLESKTNNSSSLPIHFFTIVLNGEPFIRHHIEVFRQLPFKWHWHIIEGVADLKHDTAWSLQFGGRITDEIHQNGLSNDGTTEYLNELKQQYPENITIYRKPNGVFWDGKLEMVNAPLVNINEECLLWQVDADELWTVEQICTMRSMFIQHPNKTAAYYLCHYFVGENLVITTRDTYGNHTSYEWLRTWRFKPGFRWISHEPPRLCQQTQDGQWVDIATISPFIHSETEARNIIFHHFAYVTERQICFKEWYYGYANAVEHWKALQKQPRLPVWLRDYFPWVKDESQVNTIQSQNIHPVALKNILGEWQFRQYDLLSTEPQNILCVRTDSIGDNVLAASVLPYIHEKYKNAKITVVCQEHIAELYESCPFVYDVIRYNKSLAYEDEQYRVNILQRLRALNADLVLNSVYSREPLTDAFAIGSGAKESLAFNGNLCNISVELRDKHNQFYTRLLKSETEHKPELERHRDFLKGLGIDVPYPKPIVWTTPEDEKFAEEIFLSQNLKTETTIAFFPGAQHFHKEYPQYEDVLQQIENFNIIILGGKEVTAKANKFPQKLQGKCYNMVGKTTIRQMASIIRRCKLYVGSDSAGAHIACAVGTPNIVILGGGHFGRFMPYSPFTSVVCLPLECYGCEWKCKYAAVHCVKDIKPEVITEAIQQTLDKKSERPRIFVQGNTLWNPQTNQPQWQWFHKFLDVNSVEIIPIGNVPQLKNEKTKVSDIQVYQSLKLLNSQVEQELRNGNRQKAKDILSNILNQSPNNTNALNNLAVIEILEKNWEEAVSILSKVVKVDPSNEVATKNLKYLENRLILHKSILAAENLINQKEYSEAREILEKVVDVDDKHIDALNNLAIIDILEKDYKTARHLLEKVLSIDSANEIAKENILYLNQHCSSSDIPLHAEINSSSTIDVSIVIATKDRANLLDEMLTSLIKAAPGINYEVIVIKGNSSDNTSEILHKHGIKKIYNETVYLGKERHSWPHLYNFGFSKAQGKWAMYASDDITFNEECISKAVEYLNKQKPEVAGGIFFYKNVIAERGWNNFGVDYTYGQKLLMNYGLLRLEDFRSVKGLDENYKFYCADGDLCFKLYEKGKLLIPLAQCQVIHNNVLDTLKKSNLTNSKQDIELYLQKWKHAVSMKTPEPRRLFLGESFTDVLNLKNTGISADLSATRFKTLKPNTNTLDQLRMAGAWIDGQSLRLHLGCGERRFDGYINIDYPSTEHTVQTKSAADVFADITALYFPDQTVDEIRLHHVFEHFDRPTALALLCKWHQWLKIGDNLVIETPDLEASLALMGSSQYSYKQKQGILRHIFGSHEAVWAIHKDGWYKEKYQYVLSKLGFDNIQFEFTEWQMTRNITVRVEKQRIIDLTKLQHIAKNLLRDSMIDETTSEERTWEAWSHNFDNASTKMNNTTPPKISIFIPVYNSERYLAETLDSILAQTFQDFEIIIADDGSTDKSLEIAKDYENRDKRIKILSLPHNGEVKARNEAIKHTNHNSKYLLNHDSDDISLPNKLERLVAYLEAHPEIAIVGCFAEYFDDEGNYKGQPPIEWQPERIRETFGEVNSMINSASLIRREVFDKIGYYREEYRSIDDYDFFARALTAGFDLANIPEVLHRIRLHPASVGSTRAITQQILAEKISKNYKQQNFKEHVVGQLDKPGCDNLNGKTKCQQLNKSLSILHTVEFYSPHTGGAEIVVQQISERLAKRGHRVTIATTKLDNRTIHELNGVQIEEFSIKGSHGNGIIGIDIEKYKDYLSNHPSDVMMNYAAQQWATDLAFEVVQSTRKHRVNVISPCGYSALSDSRTIRWPQFADYFNRVIPAIVPQYDAAIYHSALYQDYEYAQNYGFTNSIIIPNAVDEEELLRPPRINFREKYNIKTAFLGLCVANFYSGKGQDRIIECVGQMNREDFTMIFIGKEGDQLENLKAQATGLNVQFCVDIPREDTLAAYHEADIFLFGSYIEASPLVIIEAKASKTPFVSTDCGNVREWKGGIVCAPNEMATQANRILNDEGLRKRLADEGWREWKEKLTWESVVDKYEELYLQLVTAKRTLPSYAVPEQHPQSYPATGQSTENKGEPIAADTPTELFNRAEDLFQKGAYNESITNYKKAIEVDPSFFDAYYNLALVYTKIGQIEDAITNLRKAIELRDIDASVYNNLGVLYFKKNMHDYAKSSFEKALSIDIHYKEARKNLEKVSKVLKETPKHVLTKANSLVGLIFSKDRVMQLDGTLRSFFAHCRDIQCIHLKVIYKASDSFHGKLYGKLIQDYRDVEFIQERGFKEQVLDAIRGYTDVLFLVDDNIFVRDFHFADIIGNLEENHNALGFSMRLGKNTVHCYPLNTKQNLPVFTSVDKGILKYDWVKAEHDFGYPLEVSSSVYRVRDILPLLEHIDFSNPNTLESQMAANKRTFAEAMPALLCHEFSLTFCTPINKVQNIYNNRAGNENCYSSEALAKKYEEGFRINIANYMNFIPEGCHQEVALELKIVETKAPTVSIVIPCYKQAHFLPEAVESVVNQTFTDWECIIVNDGSLDNTTQVAESLIQKYPANQIRLINQANQGLSCTRNAGIKVSKGKYILPLDADDLIHPEMLQKMVSLLESHPEIAIAYTDVKHFGSANRVVYAGEYDFKRLCRENHLSYCSLYRREAWDAVNGYNPNMVLGYEDWDFWISCGEKGYYGKRIPEPLFMYRVKESSMYTKALERHGELMARIILNHPCLYGQKHALEAKIILDQCSTGKLKTVPMVSVIVPTYNRPDTLKRTLESIAAQTYKRIEAIVVNDAGKDVSGVIDAFQDRLSIKYLVHDKNKGLAAVRNTAIKHASGQYIAYLDDDDIFLPHHIETTLKILTTTDYKVVYTDAYRSYQTKTGNTYQVIKKDIPYSVDYSKGIFYNTNITPVLCVVHDRTCFDEVGVFDESLPVLEDWDLWIRMAEKYDFCHIKDVTCEFSWRVDGTTTTSSKQDEFARVRELIYKKYYNQFQAALMQTSAVTQKSVSIIILAWNALEYTQKCVHSIHNHTNYPYEIIFVDNASADGTVEYLRKLVQEHPNYKLIENQINKGFAAGNNQGVDAASGEYVMLLNNDVLISDGWLESLVESLEKDEKIGMVGPITNSISGRQQVISIPYVDENGFHEFAQGIRRTYKGRLTPRYRVAGFAVLMKKALYKKAGGLDESFGTGNYEDDDLCLKVREKGYAIMVDESVFIHHYRSQTFIENRIDYHNNLSTNGSKFKEKWPNVDYEQLLELHGSLVDANAALCTRGKQALESGNINESIEIYSKVLQTNPIDDTALCGLALAFQIDGKMDKTIDAYKKALKANPSFFDAYYNLAIVYANNNQVDDAIAHLNKAINLNDSDASIHNNLGVLYFKKNMYNDAANCFERALQIDAHYKEAQQNLEKVSGVLEKT